MPKLIPELEQWLHRDAAALARVRKGLAEAGRGESRAIGKAKPGPTQKSGPFAGLPTGAAAVLSARRKVPGGFNSDAEALAWILTPNADMGGATPLQALFGKDSLDSPKAAIPSSLAKSRKTRSGRVVARRRAKR